MSFKRIAFRVHGTVQGVGFRDFTQKRARSYNLTGWVEGEAQGEETSVQKLLKDIDRGPRLAHVVKLEKKELDVRDGEEDFVVYRAAESTFGVAS